MKDAPPALEPLAEDLWVASRPFPMWIGDIGTRMTVIRLRDGSLLLHSPVAPDAATRSALAAIGEPRWIVAPSKVHHLFLGEYPAAYPGAKLCGAPGLAQKRKDLRLDAVVDESLAREWGGEVQIHLFEGAPSINEVVFFHPVSRTLVLTDLAFNVTAHGRNQARLFHRLVGATGRFGPHRIVRAAIRDRAAAARSLEAILAWDFDRVIVTHGEVLEHGGREQMAASFAWLRAS